MKFFVFLILFPLLLLENSLAIEESWNRHGDFERRTVGYSLNASSFLFNAEVIDTTGYTWSRRTGLDQFRAVVTRPKTLGGSFSAEIQGRRAQEGEEWGNTFSLLRHHFDIFSFDGGRIGFQSQIFVPNEEVRPGFGIPVDWKLNEKQNLGFSLSGEHGRFISSFLTWKYMLSAYYNQRILPQLWANLNFYGEKFSTQDKLNYSHLNVGLDFRTRRGISINFGTFAPLNTQGPLVFNHFLGSSVFF